MESPALPTWLCSVYTVWSKNNVWFNCLFLYLPSPLGRQRGERLQRPGGGCWAGRADRAQGLFPPVMWRPACLCSVICGAFGPNSLRPHIPPAFPWNDVLLDTSTCGPTSPRRGTNMSSPDTNMWSQLTVIYFRLRSLTSSRGLGVRLKGGSLVGCGCGVRTQNCKRRTLELQYFRIAVL